MSQKPQNIIKRKTSSIEKRIQLQPFIFGHSLKHNVMLNFSKVQPILLLILIANWRKKVK